MRGIATTITIPSNAARRIADLLDYLSVMAEHAEDHLDDADERRELIEERAAGSHWASELRNAALQPPAPQPPAPRPDEIEPCGSMRR